MADSTTDIIARAVASWFPMEAKQSAAEITKCVEQALDEAGLVVVPKQAVDKVFMKIWEKTA